MIEKLSQDVINKIAAGEVVQRPANAIKELIENSIDAGAQNIKVKTKKGGLDQIWVEDDGSGISKDDLLLAGVRFATSKLKTYDDLKAITSFGFRGEALASISHVSHLTITSKPEGQPIAHRIQFLNGVAISSSTPCAGKNGTIINAKDLFHNMKTRKNAYHTGEEQSKIAEVLRAYAVHYHHISFMLFKLDTNTSQLRVFDCKSKEDAITMAFSKEIAQNLTSFSITEPEIGFKAESFFTNGNYSGKKMELLLFINNRMVHAKTVKQTIESVFADYLPKGSHPWVYLALSMPGSNIDVNVHPTKLEVQFLHDEKILSAIQREYDRKLAPTTDHRSMTLAPCFLNNHETTLLDLDKTDIQPKDARYPQEHVRHDTNSQKIDSFLKRVDNIRSNGAISDLDSTLQIEPRKSHKRKIDLNETVTGVTKRQKLNLDSMNKLYDEVMSKKDEKLKHLLENCSLVGVVDSTSVLVQFEVNLMLLSLKEVSYDLIYQIILKDYGNFSIVKFENPIKIRRVLLMMKIPLNEVDECIMNLMNMRFMLKDYFSIDIDTDGCITGMPVIIDGYQPNFSRLFNFIIQMKTTIEWNDEQECLHNIAQCLANFYALSNAQPMSHADHNRIIEFKFFDIIRSRFYRPSTQNILSPPTTILATLPQLYKIFERC